MAFEDSTPSILLLNIWLTCQLTKQERMCLQGLGMHLFK